MVLLLILCLFSTTEHRNMLLEDAVSMIEQSFAKCSRQTKLSSNSTIPAAELSSSSQSASVTLPSLSTVAERLQPDKVTRRLIGLLSADCELTYSELEHIISYLRLRQKALIST